MRWMRMRSECTTDLVVAAAHSRVIQPGQVVDFEEVIGPAQGAPYSLETALGPDAAKFEASSPPPEAEPEAERDAPEAVNEPEAAEETHSRRRRRS